MGLNSHVVDEAVTLTDERGKPWKPPKTTMTSFGET